MTKEERLKAAEAYVKKRYGWISEEQSKVFQSHFLAGAEAESESNWVSVIDRLPEQIHHLLRNDHDNWTPEQTFDLECYTENGDLWINRRVRMMIGNKEWVWMTNLTEDKITHFRLFDKPTP